MVDRPPLPKLVKKRGYNRRAQRLTNTAGYYETADRRWAIHRLPGLPMLKESRWLWCIRPAMEDPEREGNKRWAALVRHGLDDAHFPTRCEALEALQVFLETESE